MQNKNYKKDNELLVSINCMTYNHEAYIRNAIEGFLMQKTDFKFEVLIHDDASTDQTATIVQKYENKYPEIIKPIYQKENQYSKNISISKHYQYPRAKGKYIAICEGDDYWIDPLKLQKQVDFLEKNPDFSMSCHNAIILWENKQKRPQLFSPDALPSILGIEDILKGWYIPSASIIFRTEIIQQLPNWQNKVYNGDYFYHLWCAHHGKIKYFDELMSVYRKNIIDGDSMSANTGKDIDFIYKNILFLLDNFNNETNKIYNDLIECAKVQEYNKYKVKKLKQRYGLLHYFFKPVVYIKQFKKMIKKGA
ncbi:MAG: glycosyltransferase [Planctomycetia bacterium]|nr:glycosyltransferase [Planctomycetia bacterium]